MSLDQLEAKFSDKRVKFTSLNAEQDDHDRDNV